VTAAGFDLLPPLLISTENVTKLKKEVQAVIVSSESESGMTDQRLKKKKFDVCRKTETW